MRVFLHAICRPACPSIIPNLLHHTGFVAFVTPFQIAFMPPLLATMYTEWWDDKDVGFCNVYNRDDCCNHLEHDCGTQEFDQCYSAVRSGATIIFVLNVLVDILYWADIFLKLREPYFDEV